MAIYVKCSTGNATSYPIDPLKDNLVVFDQLDLLVIIKIAVMGGDMALPALFKAWVAGQWVSLWILAMVAARAMAGFAANTAPVIMDGEGLFSSVRCDTGDMTGEAVAVELLFLLRQG